MNIEELKLVLQTVAQLGETGKEAFVYWLFLDKLVPYIAWPAVIAGIAFTAYRIATRLTASKYLDPRSRLERAVDDVRELWLYDLAPTAPNGELHDIYKRLKAISSRHNKEAA